jgi:hypothetical protein
MPQLRALLWCLCLLLCTTQSQAQVDKTTLAVWANEAIVATYTYDYKNYLQAQKSIAKYFTADGWIAYTKALNDSKLPEAIQKNAYYVSAVSTAPPVITTLSAGNWQAVMPILVVYKNPQYQQQQNLTVTAKFTVAASGLGIRGFQIVSLLSKVDAPPCVCNAPG